jgi:hypothetical protein
LAQSVSSTLFWLNANGQRRRFTKKVIDQPSLANPCCQASHDRHLLLILLPEERKPRLQYLEKLQDHSGNAPKMTVPAPTT